ncbi:uncharacterized protein DUF3221 [Salsuginibacillus halophilus]|uniref:Uncharacterized protein DUF3221 n=1 Tax=Salsuginibacillus halophilus TaxID=517424 RepID=A0A2P8HAF8_9BACI|nr:YobA family protein [Salsuginibacillus halophilus]PSL43213.1 uncharacterized protein DUF3221 [Salsuginibacillus halophilus]
MRKRIFISIFFLMFIASAGCGTEVTSDELNPSEANVQEGYVVDKSEERILVISDITEEEAVESSQEELLDGENEAVWYTVEDTATYEIGQLLRLEWDHMAESYPGQSEPEHVQVVDEG